MISKNVWFLVTAASVASAFATFVAVRDSRLTEPPTKAITDRSDPQVCFKFGCKAKRDTIIYPGEKPPMEDLDCRCLDGVDE